MSAYAECQCCRAPYVYGDGETRTGPETCSDCEHCCESCHAVQAHEGADDCSDCGNYITERGKAQYAEEWARTYGTGSKVTSGGAKGRTAVYCVDCGEAVLLLPKVAKLYLRDHTVANPFCARCGKHEGECYGPGHCSGRDAEVVENR